MNIVFVLQGDLLLENRHGDGVDHQKQDLAAVQRGKRQQVHHRQIHGDQCRQIGDVADGGPYCLRRFAHLCHGGHDAYRPAEIPQTGLAGQQHFQAQPHQPHEIHGIIPAVGDPVAPCGLFHTEEQAVAGIAAAALVGVLPLFHREVCQRDLFPVPAYYQIKSAVVVHVQQQPHITVHIYPLSVNGQQGIAHLQAVLRLQRAALGKGGDGRVVESLCTAVQQQ